MTTDGRIIRNFVSATFSHNTVWQPHQMARLMQNWWGSNPIPILLGYDPQKLLPAPGSDPSWLLRDILAVFDGKLGIPWITENVFRPSDFNMDDQRIDFDVIRPARRNLDWNLLYGGSPQVRRGWRYKRAVLIVESDYSGLEARLLAAEMPGVVAVELDMRDPYGAIPGPLAEMFAKPVFEPKPAAVKQNGRSSSYLDHDPTKKHRGRRR